MMQYNMFNLFNKSNSKLNKLFFSLKISSSLLIISLTGCITTHNIDKTPIPTVEGTMPSSDMQTTTWNHLDGWLQDDISKAWSAWLLSCDKLKLKPEWSNVCSNALSVPNDIQAQRNYFEENFILKELSGQTSKLTGYYEPILLGSRVKSSKFSYPIYKMPKEWKNTKINLPTREQISRQNLLSGHEIIYLDNPIDCAYLHVQGSGQISLEDGKLIRLSYAGNNGHQFKSFAQGLINKGELTRGQASIAGIKQWAANNPSKVDNMLNVNPRFIFFNEAIGEVTSANGAIGALGVPLTPQRSIAVDTSYVTLGAPVFIKSINPNGGELKKLVIAQDIGNAIKGQVRADFFWGSGIEAGESAGKTNYPLSMWVLTPKQ